MVEMLVVIVIIGILLALMLPVFAKAISKARSLGRPVDPNDPSKPGWGGQFEKGRGGWYFDPPATETYDPRTGVSRWRPAFQEDFALRMGWSRDE